jgi:putative transposase
MLERQLGGTFGAMPRQPRTFEPGGLYHLFSRGSCRREISIDDGDRIDFLVCAERAFARHGMECLTYVLMPNHYHFVVHTPNGAISAPMKELNGRYSLRFNRRHGRVAHTFKNRFGAVHLKREGHMLWATAYVAANPVRAGLCPRPEDWPWSSYRATMGLEQALGLFKAARLLSYFGSIEADARRHYAALVADCSSFHSARSPVSGAANGMKGPGMR